MLITTQYFISCNVYSIVFLRASAVLKHVIAIGWTSVCPFVRLSICPSVRPSVRHTLVLWDGVGKRSYIMPKRNEPGVSVQHRGRLAVGRIIIMYAAAEVSD